MVDVGVQGWRGQKVEARTMPDADVDQLREAINALDNAVTTEVT